MAKKFFYVCAGLLLLAAAYHLGVGTVRAQVSGDVSAANIEIGSGWTYYTCAVGRTFRYGLTLTSLFNVPQVVPGSAPIVATGHDGIYLTAILASGDVYQWDGSSAWILRANILGGATPASTQSFGALKARYR